MPGQPRDTFIARVRTALHDRGQPVDLPDDLEIARVIAPDDDVVRVFLDRAAEAKIHPYRVTDEKDLIDLVAGIVEKAGARSVLIPAEELPAREGVIARLKQGGVTLLDPDDPDAAFDADVGITAVTAAVAETASICLTSGDRRRRLASLAVPVHVGVVRAEQILPDLLDWFASDQTARTASEVLVSAPSKTADIELSLVMGVHGPKEEHVIVLG